MPNYISSSGYDHIQALDAERSPLLPVGTVDNEPYAVEPMKYDQSSALVPSHYHHKRLKSHSTIVTLDKINQWTRGLLPEWAVARSVEIDSRSNEILYSVFKPVPGFDPIKSVPPEGFDSHNRDSRARFEQIVDDVVDTVERGEFLPQRISAGSSGSYFVYNSNGDIVGVFKPKDEEPYGPLSPKWSKFIHRTLFPCFFGRSCLIPNLGYICESAASLLDRQLQSYIVPFTDTVSLSSPTFYYSFYDRVSARITKKKLPRKVGSLQLFLKGYVQADEFLRQHPLPGSRSWGIFTPSSFLPSAHPVQIFKWTDEVLQHFQQELEKLVILDYIMRNTDRGLDNWMINLEWEDMQDGLTNDTRSVPRLRIGAIDSGLSWPWKHPDEWRSFPFGWLYLPVSIIGRPFSEATRNHYLPLLTSTAWWEDSSVLFREMFSRDSEFKERMWKKQWAVMKGQAFNVVETLKIPGQGPLELVRRTRMTVWDEEMDVPLVIPVSVMANAMETPIWNNTGGSSIINQSSATGSIGKGIADEDQFVSGTINEYAFAKNQFKNNLENYQDRWSQLVKGDINERQFETGINHEAADTDTDITGPSSLITTQEGSIRPILATPSSSATKRVIIERLQTADSKPPVFTWC